MKRIVFILSIMATFAACSNNSKTKVQTKEEAFKEVRDSIQLDSLHNAEAKKLELTQKEAQLAAKTVSTPNSSTSRRTYVKGVSESYTNPAPEKKGWSKAAKGAAIGAGVGAVTGVIVDKKDGRGAIIGGLAGAGAGYAIGRSKDKKDGRVQ